MDETLMEALGRLLYYVLGFITGIAMLVVVEPWAALGLLVVGVLIAVPVYEAKKPLRMPPKTVIKRPPPKQGQIALDLSSALMDGRTERRTGPVNRRDGRPGRRAYDGSNNREPIAIGTGELLDD